MRLGEAVEDVQRAEADLASEFRAIGERHAGEHIYHMTHTLASQCDYHLHELAPVAARYGATPPRNSVSDAPSLLETVRRREPGLAGRPAASGTSLLGDLRMLYLASQEAELAWVILGQGARAVRDADLLEVTSGCHEHAEARGKWLRTRIKESAPQVLATGK
jgi:hypothetical protein